MKNNLLIIWLISISILFSPQIVLGASSTCSIETEPDKVLSDYIQNLRKAVSNTNKSLLSQTSNKDTSTLSVTWNDISRIYNEMINWDWFYTDFKYYLTFPMLNDIPAPIQRDLTMLENETEWLRSYLKTLVKKWYSWVSLTKEEVCNWVENCSLQWSPINIIGDIIKNHTEIITLYKETVTTPSQTFKRDLILVSQNSEKFIAELKKNYWDDTIWECSEIKKTFSEKIEVILENNTQWKDWIQKWKEAWKLLVWSSDNQKYAEKEYELLQNELSHQWLSSSAQDIMLENLKEFNQNNFYTLDNNFIVNSAEQIYNAWVIIKDWFQEATKGFLWSEDTKQINEEASIWINTLLNSTDKVNITESIKKRIDILNRTHLEYAAIESYSTVKLQADIIQMHSKIKHSSETLRDTCELAVKVCNDQWTWKWNCWSCK